MIVSWVSGQVGSRVGVQRGVGGVGVEQVVQAPLVAQVVDGEPEQLHVLLVGGVPRTPPEPVSVPFVPGTQDHRDQGAVRASGPGDGVGNPVQPGGQVGMPGTAR